MTDEIGFELVTETEKPKTTYVKDSKFDPILDKFLASGQKLVSLKLKEAKEANYVRTQLKKRLDIRVLNDQIEASVVNSKVYLSLKEAKVEAPPTVEVKKE